MRTPEFDHLPAGKRTVWVDRYRLDRPLPDTPPVLPPIEQPLFGQDAGNIGESFYKQVAGNVQQGIQAKGCVKSLADIRQVQHT